MTPTPQQDTAAMAIAWSERAKAAMDLRRQYLAGAEAVIEQDSPVADPWHEELRLGVYKALTAAADRYEWYADQARQAAQSCRQHVRRTDDDLKAVLDWMPPAPGVYSPEQGRRSYDPPLCDHGGLQAVCDFTPCDSGTYTDEQIAEFYRGGAA